MIVEVIFIIYLQEIGDVSLGQILVCGAIFRSGQMLKASIDEQSEVINILFSSSSKKSYLGIVAYQILLDFINNVGILCLIYLM